MINKLEELTLRLNKAEELQELVLTTIPVGVWDWYMDNTDDGQDILVWDDVMFKMFGVEKKSDRVNYAFFEDCVLEPDRDIIKKLISDAIGTRTLYKFIFRLKYRPGVKVYGAGRCYYDEDDIPYRFIGICIEAPRTECPCSLGTVADADAVVGAFNVADAGFHNDPVALLPLMDD